MVSNMAESFRGGSMRNRYWWSKIVPAWVVDGLDACAVSGEGPHQDFSDRAFEAVAKAAEKEPDQCPEATYWAFVRDRYCWGVPLGSAFDSVATQHRSVTEIGCGSGYVAACLATRGMSVRATNAKGE